MSDEEEALPRIWVDADATPKPVKQMLFKAAERRGVEVILVANVLQSTPKCERIRAIGVASGLDVADEYIAAECGPGDLVITADVPLASAVVEAGALALDPRGELLSDDNVGERRAVRDLMTDLRDNHHMQTGGPRPYDDVDKQRFANALDRWITKRLRKR